MCSIQFRCLFLVIVSRDLSSSISFNTSSFDMFSVQLIFSILCHIHSSMLSNLVMSSFLRVHVSAQYCRLQGPAPNQCFHHSLLETSFLSSWKRLSFS